MTVSPPQGFVASAIISFALWRKKSAKVHIKRILRTYFVKGLIFKVGLKYVAQAEITVKRERMRKIEEVGIVVSVPFPAGNPPLSSLTHGLRPPRAEACTVLNPLRHGASRHQTGLF